MKEKFFITLICLIFFFSISCDTDNILELNSDYIEVDYRAQDVIIVADRRINMVTYNIAHSDTGLGDHYVDGDIQYSVGDWFVITLDNATPCQAVISMQENQTGNDRKIEVHLTRNAGGAVALVVQKAKPTE